MKKLVFKALVLAMMVFGLIELSSQKLSLAANRCTPQACQESCVKKGYPFGTCGSITHACVCYSYPPPID